MKLSKRLSSSIVVSAAVLAVTPALVRAAPSVLSVGTSVDLQDPSDLGRSVPLTFTGGSATLEFSTDNDANGQDPFWFGGAVAAFNVLNLQIKAESSTTQVEQAYGLDPFNDQVRIRASVTNELAAVSVNPVSGALADPRGSGAFTWVGTRIRGTLAGGAVTVSNLRFDLDGKRVVADLDGLANNLSGGAPQVFSLRDSTLFTIRSISGPTSIPVERLFSADRRTVLQDAGFVVDSRTFEAREQVGFAADGGCPGPAYLPRPCANPLPSTPIYQASTGYFVTGETRLSGLALTQQGYDFLSNTLGLVNTGRTALGVVAGDFGTVTIKTSYTLGVPEPSTYALMALGLGLMVGAVRRNQRLAA